MGVYHDQVAESLATAIDTPYLGIPLGSVWVGDDEGKHPGLADVIAIKPSYTRFCMSIYEVKISRADFMSDIRKEKWKRYLPHCHRFYFATVDGVCTKEDIPDEAGWYVKGKKGWSCRKAAKVRDLEVPQRTLLAMLFAQPRDRRFRRLKDAAWLEKSRDKKEGAKLLGKDVAEAWAMRNELDRLADLANMRIETLQAYVEQAHQLSREFADIPDNSYVSPWRLEREMRKILEEARQKVGA